MSARLGPAADGISINTLDGDYRSDIDGLRAIAVLAVLGFHASAPGFGAGFIGVDIFFVISGYLISGIILRSFAAGLFSILDFYRRRINRIFPALIIVLLCSALLGWIVLYSDEYQNLGKHTAAGAGFLSNIVLSREAGYFDNPVKPLLHLWSLGVEEQFYIIFPPLVLLFWQKRNGIRWMLIALIAVSFTTNLFFVSRGNANAAFYMPQARFWEILAGGLLRHWELSGHQLTARIRDQAWVPNACSFSGLVLLLVTFVLVDDKTPWPSGWAVMPVFGTLLLISGRPRAFINRAVLSASGLVAIGLISYPLYLWHWPLLLLAKLANEGNLAGCVRALIVATSFVLAWATHRFVERPICFGMRSYVLSATLALVLAAVGGIGLLLHSGYIGPRLGQSTAYEDRWRPNARETGFKPFSQGARQNSIVGVRAGTVVFTGDSHVEQYWPRIDTLSRTLGTEFPTVISLSAPGCPPISNINPHGTAAINQRWFCEEFNQKALNRLSMPDVTDVVLVAFWESYFSDRSTFLRVGNSEALLTKDGASVSAALKGLEREIETLQGLGKRVFIVLSSPAAPEFDPKLLSPSRLPWRKKANAVTSLSRKKLEEEISPVGDSLRALAARRGVTTIDPFPFLCDSILCSTITQGKPRYHDYHHIRASFARTAAVFIDTVFTNPARLVLPNQTPVPRF